MATRSPNYSHNGITIYHGIAGKCWPLAAALTVAVIPDFLRAPGCSGFQGGSRVARERCPSLRMGLANCVECDYLVAAALLQDPLPSGAEKMKRHLIVICFLAVCFRSTPGVKGVF